MAESEPKRPDEKVNEEKVESSPPWPLITIGIVGTVVVLALVVGGWLFVRSHIATTNHVATSSQSGRFGDRRMSRQGGGMHSGGVRGLAATRGVITAIDGDTVTVSGGGKQVTVKRTSNTVIGGDKTTIAVNDTVAVIGDTASDGTVTATRIVVQNQDFGGPTADIQSDSAEVPGA